MEVRRLFIFVVCLFVSVLFLTSCINVYPNAPAASASESAEPEAPEAEPVSIGAEIPSSGGYIIPDSDTRYLSAADFQGLSKEALGFARNEIYARHGNTFDKAKYQEYFDAQPWYVASHKVTDAELSDVEKANVQLILQLEEGDARSAATPAPDNNYYVISDSSVRYLTVDDCEWMDKETLALARNEIYARHGNKFDKKKYQDYFASQAWYAPVHKVSDSELSAVEKANVRLLLDLENGVAQARSAPEQNDYFILPGSDVAYLSDADLEGFSLDTLALARNEIYARHGNIFDTQKYKDYFGSQAWYAPDHKVSDNELSAVEKANVQLILDWEAALGG